MSDSQQRRKSTRLLINALGLRLGGGLTVGLYILRGIRQLRQDYDILALVPAGRGYEELCSTLAIAYRAFPVGRAYPVWRLWFDQVQVPLIARRWSADVLFMANNQAALSAPCPQVVLFQHPFFIYPLSEWWHFFTASTRISLLVQRGVFFLSARRAARVLAQTTVAAKRLHDQYGIQQDRLVIVPMAPAPEHDDPETEAARRVRCRMKDAASGRISVLTLAKYYPHKHLEFVVRVARRLRELGDRRFAFVITIAAEQHPGARVLLEAIEREHLANEVINLGPIGYTELRSAYTGARVCFIPSLLESMSGSHVEALLYRLPIVTTDRDFSRATCGPAARYFPHDDVDAAIEQLQAVADSSCRAERSRDEAPPRRYLDVCRDIVAIIESARPVEARAAAASENVTDCSG